MMAATPTPPFRKASPGFLPLLLAAAVAVLSALPYAGSANDGSRLAAVESLVDYHTWAIDHSVFVRTPGVRVFDMQAAHPDEELGIIQQGGAIDKMFIRGHYYSDKSPVPLLAMAAVYKVLQMGAGITVVKNPRLFCYLLTVIFSGVSYVIAVALMNALIAAAGLARKPHLLLTGGFAFATVALPYVRQINNNIMLLAVFSLVMWLAVKYSEGLPSRLLSWHLPAIGTCIGMGYTIDLGAGPVLVLCVAGWLGYRTRSAKAVAIALAAAFPWFLLHHALNYRIGGTFKPANSVPAYFQWPGSPFDSQNLTNGWAHQGAWDFITYATGLFLGNKGFICYNLPLYLALPGVWILLREKSKDKDIAWLALSLILGTWLVYAIASNNYSGSCCSIRWFVPLLAPFYYLLAIFLKNHPRYIPDLAVLTATGLAMGFVMWVNGPWMEHLPPFYWWFQGISLAAWAVCRVFNAGPRGSAAL